MCSTSLLMEPKMVLICLLAATANAASHPKIKLEFDRPGLRLAVSMDATIRCCYTCQASVKVIWIRDAMTLNKTCVSKQVDNETHAHFETRVKINNSFDNNSNVKCSYLMLRDIRLSDTGLYKCLLKQSDTIVHTPGTYLQVYVPFKKMLDISEGVKNSIIIAEGILLLLLVLVPGIVLIYKAKGMNKLRKTKGKEEENIYEGLNLDDCNSTYHQIQRSYVRGPYQDIMPQEEDDSLLEKP